MNTRERTPTLLVVDDIPDNLHLLNSLLRNNYKVLAATSGEKALRIAQDTVVDLVLLDVMMPGMDGYEVCRRLRADERTCEVPILFLTAKNQVEDEEYGLALGANDYLSKPIHPPTLMARVQTQLRLKAASDALRVQNATLDEEVFQRTSELKAVHDVTILLLASLAEARDHETGAHLIRTQNYVKALAEQLSTQPRFADQLDQRSIELMSQSAQLHDIGKVGIPDYILLKPGPLEPAEFEVMKKHPRVGYQALAQAEKLFGTPQRFLQFAKEITLGHHEKWDGSGYPQGLSGEAIPLSARLMAVADVYDAIVNRRVYKPAMGHEKAVNIIREGRGRHFDPDVVDAFLEVADQFHHIATSLSDNNHALETPCASVP